MSFPTWKTNTGNSFIFPNSILDGQVDVSGTFYNRTGNVIIGDSSNPDFDPSSNGITLNTTRICLGKDTSVTGDNGVAIGNSATTGLQENSISIGYNSIVDASNSVAIGPDASANGLNSIALGYNSGTGSYTNSIALGANSTVGANNVISLGDGTQKVGIGVTSPNRELDVDGSVKITDWFRVSGTGGIHWEDYSGGWYMNDSTWLRTWNNSSIWAGSGTIATNGSVGIGGSSPSCPLHINTTATVKGPWNAFGANNSNGDYAFPVRSTILAHFGHTNGDANINESYLITTSNNTNGTANVVVLRNATYVAYSVQNGTTVRFWTQNLPSGYNTSDYSLRISQIWKNY